MGMGVAKVMGWGGGGGQSDGTWWRWEWPKGWGGVEVMAKVMGRGGGGSGQSDCHGGGECCASSALRNDVLLVWLLFNS